PAPRAVPVDRHPLRHSPRDFDLLHERHLYLDPVAMARGRSRPALAVRSASADVALGQSPHRICLRLSGARQLSAGWDEPRRAPRTNAAPGVDFRSFAAGRPGEPAFRARAALSALDLPGVWVSDF